MKIRDEGGGKERKVEETIKVRRRRRETLRVDNDLKRRGEKEGKEGEEGEMKER
jgi:hypothetical protein